MTVPAKRFEDWPERLDAVLRDAASRPFARGGHDCALFAAEAVFVMTGVDPRTPFAGRYKTARGAAGALKRAGGTLMDVAAAIVDGLGGIEVAAPFAQRGDIAYVEVAGDSALAVMDLTGRFVTTGPGITGLIAVPGDCVLRVWRIG